MAYKYNLTDVYKSYGRKGTAFNSWVSRTLGKYAKLNNLNLVVVKGGNNPELQGTYTDSTDLYNKTVDWASNNLTTKTTFLREEHQFGKDIVHNLFGGYTIQEQFSCCGNKYRIDWYITELKLAIEFDEPQHNLNMENDSIRQKEIEAELKCKFLRYTYNNE